jgi:capsular exopolysaccharide synthesis family protein
VQKPTPRRPLITLNNPKSPISESYRALRTNIQFSSIDHDIRIIMVTSAGPGEGKSTTAANLAVTYAQSDKQVLVIDSDLRKPTMHHTFSVSNRSGISNILTGQSKSKDVISETSVPNLFLLPSGPIPPNPSEMLNSKRMKDLITELLQHFDYIVIDTPPALAVTDAQIVSTLCDGVLLVVDADSVKSGPAMKAKANLDHVQARILGVVLNNMDRDQKEYYYYYYGDKKN